METKLARMNDPLPLTLGARVTLRPEEKRVADAEIDIDLTEPAVKWVGDVFDDEVQTSDMRHEAFAAVDTSDQLEFRLFGVDPANLRGDVGAVSKVWMDAKGVYHAEPVAWPAVYKAPTPPTVYTIDGRRGGYTEAEYLAWLQAGAPKRGPGDLPRNDTASGMRLLMQASQTEIARLGRELAQKRGPGDLPRDGLSPMPVYLYDPVSGASCGCDACVEKRSQQWGASVVEQHQEKQRVANTRLRSLLFGD